MPTHTTHSAHTIHTSHAASTAHPEHALCEIVGFLLELYVLSVMNLSPRSGYEKNIPV